MAPLVAPRFAFNLQHPLGLVVVRIYGRDSKYFRSFVLQSDVTNNSSEFSTRADHRLTLSELSRTGIEMLLAHLLLIDQLSLTVSYLLLVSLPTFPV